MRATVWTGKRKWLGNLIPTLFWMVPTLLGIRQILLSHQLIGTGLVWLIGADVLGWIALNQFGLYQNSRMRRRLTAILSKKDSLGPDPVFVGFSSPKFSGVLDAHEDVGFLCFNAEDLVFVSETRRVEMRRDEIKSVRYRPNVHTMVGLGRWISVDGVRNKLPIRMLLEPREKRTMAGNLFYGRILQKKIHKWRQS